MNFLLTRFNQLLLLLVLLTLVLYYGQPFLIPLFFGMLLAMLMAPVCRFLDQHGFNRALSCTCCIIILVIAIGGLIAIVIAQINEFSSDMELIRKKASELWQGLQLYIEGKLHINPAEQDAIIKEQSRQMRGSSLIDPLSILGNLAGVIGGISITLVFTFLMLFHKEKYEQFFLKLFRDQDQQELRTVLEQVTRVSQQYLTGRALSMIFLFVLYTIALLIIGIKNALLLSAIAAILTIIPYLGPVLGGLFPFMTAIVTEDSLQPAVWVAVSIFLIQAIDNYFVEPVVIGGEVQLSALATIASILAGGLIWGISGMILFIPMVSIAKIIFDHVRSLKPYGFLIGDQGKSPSDSIRKWFKKKQDR